MLLVGTALGGCSLRMGDLNAVSAKNIGLNAQTVRSHVEGRDCVHNVLGIPIGSLVPSIEEATDRALASAPGANALTDAVLYQEPLFLLVYARSCFRVTGDAVKITQPGEGSQ